MQLLQGRELWRCRQLRRGLSCKICLASFNSVTHFNIDLFLFTYQRHSNSLNINFFLSVLSRRLANLSS